MPASPQGDAPLPILSRLAIAYLMAPVFVWLLGWFEWWFGVPAAILLGAGLRPALGGSWRIGSAPVVRRWVVVGIAAGAWTMLTASGGVFDGNIPEFGDHRALLLDLSRHPWPPFLRDDLADYLPGVNADPALLRHYVGWHIVPALAGRIWGPAALNWAVPLWTALGVGLVLLLFVRDFRGWRALLAAAIFIFFSGMDVLRAVAVGDVDWNIGIDQRGWPGLRVGTNHLDFEGMFGFTTALNSHMAALMFVPKHFLPAGLYALLLLQLWGRARFVRVSGVLLAAAPLWSAFVAIGLLPFVAIMIWRNGGAAIAARLRRFRPDSAAVQPAAPEANLRRLFSWQNVAVAVPLGIVVALYLASGSLDFRSVWIWRDGVWALAPWAAAFYLSEFLLLALLLLALRRSLRRQPFFVASVLTLLLLPVYQYGPSNDLLLRGGMPALVLLCYFCAQVVASPSLGGGHARLRRRRCAFGCVLAVLVVGALNAGVELARATRDDAPFSFRIAGLTVFAADPNFMREDIATDLPAALRWLLADRAAKPSSPPPRQAPQPLVRAEFHVHYRDRKLFFVRQPCRGGFDEPILVAFGPRRAAQTGARTQWAFQTRRVGTACARAVGLPGYPLASACAGQVERYGRALAGVPPWEVELTFDDAGRLLEAAPAPGCFALHRARFADRQALRRAWRMARREAPALRADWALYRDDAALVFFKESCTADDLSARFFLHVTPADPSELSARRRRHGFDNLDFVFGERGTIVEGDCVALARLPDYDVERVRVGQFTSAGELWRAEL